MNAHDSYSHARGGGGGVGGHDGAPGAQPTWYISPPKKTLGSLSSRAPPHAGQVRSTSSMARVYRRGEEHRRLGAETRRSHSAGGSVSLERRKSSIGGRFGAVARSSSRGICVMCPTISPVRAAAARVAARRWRF